MEELIDIRYLIALIASWIVAGWIHMVKEDCDSSYDSVPLHHTTLYGCFTAFPFLAIIVSLIINIFKVSFFSTLCYAGMLIVTQLINRNILYYIYRSLFGNDGIGTVIPLILVILLLIYLFAMQNNPVGTLITPLYLFLAAIVGAFIIRGVMNKI